MPKFGKQWLDNFIADAELQNTFVTSEVVRNIVMLQCVYFASIFNDLLLYKHAFLGQDPEARSNASSNNQKLSHELMKDLPCFKIGIIGCGQVGTMILTKLIEVAGSFNQL